MATKRSSGGSKKAGKGAAKKGASKKGASKKASKKGAGKRAGDASIIIPPFQLPPCVVKCINAYARCLAAAKTPQERTRCMNQFVTCVRGCIR